MKYKLKKLKTQAPYLSGIGTYDYYETIPYRFLVWHTVYDYPPDTWLVMDMDSDIACQRPECHFTTKREVLKFINPSAL